MAQIILPAYGWKPEKHQIEIYNALASDQYDEYIIAAHRRFGKDEITLHSTVRQMVSKVGDYWHMLPQANQARRAIWEATNPRTGRIRWKDAFPPELIAKTEDQAMKLRLRNNSSWQVLGSDNVDGLVGSTPIWVAFSEAALADPTSFGLIRPILAENGGKALYISSVRGRNHFYNMYKAGLKRPRTFVASISAKDTNVFSNKQLDLELERYISDFGESIGESMFKQEYLCDWDASAPGTVFAKELEDLRKSGRACPIPYDPAFPVYTFWDLGVADLTTILFFQMIGDEPRLIDWHANNGIGLEDYARVLASKPYYYQAHYAPHDIGVREFTSGLSRIEEAKRFGIYFQQVIRLRKDEQISAGSRLIKRMKVNVIDNLTKNKEADCEFILEKMNDYKFKFDTERKVMSKNPEHNDASHYADALLLAGVVFANMGRATKAAPLQGRTITEQMRLRDVFRMQRAKKRTGAF